MATGAAECMAMQTWQWSASLSTSWVCATWTKISIANRASETSAAAPNACGIRRRFGLEFVSKWVGKSILIFKGT
jgi:hypothetical protein